MGNTLLQSLIEDNNYKRTENGAVAQKSTLNAIYDLFALGGAYRTRSDDDCIFLFKKAFEADRTLAMKCLFYLRDIRGGQGERRFFRVCFDWLAREYPEVAFKNIDNVPEYGRWDDLYALVGSPLEADVFDFMKAQLMKDIHSYDRGEKEGVSLLAKWLKSENTSSVESKKLGNLTRKWFRLSHKSYRQILSRLRNRINIVETLMSQNRWDEIEFEKLPSKAGLIYRNAFAHNDVTAERYANFMTDKDTKVNAGTLYPYDIVSKVTNKLSWRSLNLDAVERATINKYWENQIDYFNGADCKMLAVVDTSSSMDSSYGTSVKPIDVAISLGVYCAERIQGAFHGYYISFASRPQLVAVNGVDFCDKVKRIYETNLCDNTNLIAVFDLLYNKVTSGQARVEDLPDKLVIISDMEIDQGCGYYWNNNGSAITDMERVRAKWERVGLKMPQLIYWNVAARHDTILEDANNEDVTFVSGCSPVIFKSVLTGKTSIDLMLEVLNSERYSKVEGEAEGGYPSMYIHK